MEVKIFSIVNSSVNRAKMWEASNRCPLVEEIPICEMNVWYSLSSGVETLTDVSCNCELRKCTRWRSELNHKNFMMVSTIRIAEVKTFTEIKMLRPEAVNDWERVVLFSLSLSSSFSYQLVCWKPSVENCANISCNLVYYFFNCWYFNFV